MYSSAAGLLVLSYLNLSKGKVSHMLLYWVHCNTQCSSLGSLVFTHLGGIEGIMWLTDIIINLYYYYSLLPFQHYKHDAEMYT